LDFWILAGFRFYSAGVLVVAEKGKRSFLWVVFIGKRSF
jgi:hypothetical protein